jgi:hypothetical protein
MPADAAQYTQLVAAQGLSRENLSTMATGSAAQSVRSFDQWYDDSAVASWAGRLSALIQSILRQTAALTDSYLSQVASLTAGQSVPPVGTIDVSELRAGVTPAEAYLRPAEQFRYARSQGADEAKATQAALQRAEVLAETDVALAARAQSRRFMVVHRVDGFRRVIHPELSKSGTCGLCIAAADRIYHRAELMPLHDRCACTTTPIINGIDPGHSLNRSDLDALYKAAGSTGRADLSKVRITVHHHGELGPLLAPKGAAFRGPADLPRAS